MAGEHKVVVKIMGEVTKSFGSALKTAGAMAKSLASPAKVGEMAFKGLGAATKASAGLMAASAGAMATVASASARVGSEFEAQMSKVSSIAGSVAGGELARLSKAAKGMGLSYEEGADSTETAMNILSAKAQQMGATTSFSASEAGEAMEYMAMAGWKATDMVQGIDGIMNLAAASGEELGTTSDIVTDALTAFGLSASDAGHFSDVLAAASSNANTNVSMMGETFKYAGAMAGALGYSAEDVALMTGLMANSGIKASMAGTSINAVFTRLSTNTAGAADALSALGIEFYDSSGNARDLSDVMGELRAATAGMTDEQKTQLANTIAGTEAQKGLLAVLNASEKDYKKLSDAINDADGAAKEMAATRLDNLQGDVTLLKSAAEGLGIAFYQNMQEPLRGAAQFASEQLSAMSQAFNAGGFQGLAAQVGRSLGDAASLVAQKAPEFVAAAGALAGGLVEGISQNAGRIGPAVAEAFTGFVGQAAALAPQMILAGGQLLASLMDGLAKEGPKLQMQMPGIISKLVQGIGQLLPRLVQSGTGLVLSLVQGLLQAVPQLIAQAPAMVGSLVQGLLQSIPTIMQAGVQLLSALVANVPGIVTSLVNQLPQIVNGIVMGLIQNAPMIMQAGVELLSTLATSIPLVVPQLVTALPQLVSGIVTGLAQNAPQIVMAGVQLMGQLLKNVPAILGQLLISVGHILAGIIAGMAKGRAMMASAGLDLIKGLWQGIQNAAGWIKEKVTGFAKGVVDKFKGALGIHSPSKEMAYVGDMMAQGLAGGISDGGVAALGAARGLAKSVAEVPFSLGDASVAQGGAVPAQARALASPAAGGAAAPAQGGGTMHVTFSPVLNFNGGAPGKEEVVEAVRMSEAEFEKMMDAWMRRNRRTRFAPGMA